MRLRVGLFLVVCLLLGAGLVQLTAPAPPDVTADDRASPGRRPQAATTAEPKPPQPDLNPPLPQRLAGLVAHEGVAGQVVGVSVTDADGRPVFEHHAGAHLLPASAQKLPVAAAALATLGPDFRYETMLRATSRPEPGGVLHGDLVLVGSGDPALATPQYGQLRPDRPRTPLEALADRVTAGGITRITGAVLGDPGVFPHQPQAPGWVPRYLEQGNTTRSSGLTAEGGRRLFIEGGRVRSVPAADPATTAAAALHALLVERGVVIDGGAAATATPPPAPVNVGGVTSPPLLDLLRYTLQRSDNHLADAIFRTIGTASGDATWAGSAAATRQALEALGLDLAGTAMADGSGLSRGDRLSATFLTALDARMTDSTHGSVWRSLMAVAGESGTLQRRLVGSVAEGRLRGKTGSLQDVMTLSGTVIGPDGSRFHFAVLGNDLDGPGMQAVRRLQDLVVLALAEDLYGCAWEPAAPPATADPDRPADQELALVCPT
ncbi:MAG: D-alanyl-D-alanine carboxypeptidase/D-alanyl-D-alanine-endopeptidase [Egibacteraceae bacterium]